MTTQLPVAIEAISIDNAPAIYKADGLKPFIAHIKEQVTGEVPDLTTKKGRDRIASLAAQVSRSKTAVEKPGREYLKHLKELPKTIEAELREFVNACDSLRDEVRKPLTDWEEAEQARIDSHKYAIASFSDMAISGESSSEIQLLISGLESRKLSEQDCEEYFSQYVTAKESAIEQLKSRHAAALQAEFQAAELVRLKKEAAEREQKEREERIAREAAEAARRQAEEEARRQREAAERAERDRQLEAERREMQLKLEAENAERRRLEAEQRQADELKQAELRAQQAVENERRRIEQEQAAAKAEADRQAENKAHRASVNREILAALVGAGLTEENAKLVITMAAKGSAGRLTVNY